MEPDRQQQGRVVIKASASSIPTFASRSSSARPTTNGPGGTTSRRSATATGPPAAPKNTPLPPWPHRRRCRPIASATGTRAAPSAAPSLTEIQISLRLKRSSGVMA